jgi:hypothetical protein
MANVVASEITRMSESMISNGYDLMIVEIYIDHAFLTADTVSAANIGVHAILGILGATRVNTSGAVIAASPDAAGAALFSETRAILGDEVSGAADIASPSDPPADHIAFGSDWNTDLGGYLCLLCKAT